MRFKILILITIFFSLIITIASATTSIEASYDAVRIGGTVTFQGPVSSGDQVRLKIDGSDVSPLTISEGHWSYIWTPQEAGKFKIEVSDSSSYDFVEVSVEYPTYQCNYYLLATSPNGKYVAEGCARGEIFLFDQQGNVIWKKTFGDSTINSISFSTDGNYIDASNMFHQAFYIGLDGNIVARPATPPPQLSHHPSL